VGFLWGGPKVRERLRLGLFGVRARTRGGIAVSDGARLGLGLAARAVGVRGKREHARGGGYAGCRGAGQRAGLADDARERGRDGEEKRKREARRLELPGAERATRQRGASGDRGRGRAEEAES
jgi:hypothetical protein